MAVAWLAISLAVAAAKRHSQETLTMLPHQGPTVGSSCGGDRAMLRAVLQKLRLATELRQHKDHCQWMGISCDDGCVESISLVRCNLTGELPVELGNLKRLRCLYLSENPSLSGSLRALRPLAQLEELDLYRTHISGGLNELRDLKNITDLTLTKTQIDGKLEALTTMKHIRRLELADTKIQGRLEDIKGLDQLNTVKLSSTGVTGQLEALHGLKEMLELDLSKTRITGRLQDLLHFPKLEEAWLSGTAVSGRLTPEWLGRLGVLRILDLAETQASFVPTEVHSAKILDATYGDQPMLPALTVLDVSRCPLNSPVLELLQPLINSRSIAKLSAAGSNLTGRLPDYLTDQYFAESLQTLDLSLNHIELVEGMFTSSLLALAENPNVSFAPGVLQKAIRTGVRVDLRGVDLTEKEAGDALELLPVPSETALGGREITVERGFACYSLEATVLQVTPERFLPDHFCHCKPMHARLNMSFFKCLYPAKSRCTGVPCTGANMGCAEGYDGILCSTCAEGFRSHGGHCERCSDDYKLLTRLSVGGVLLFGLVAAGVFARWRRNSAAAAAPVEAPPPQTPWDALVPLLAAQGPVLLQLLQLWAVLTELSPPLDADADHEVDKQTEQEIAQFIQMTVTSIHDAFRLECEDGRMARIFVAFASPMFPLLLLALCSMVEVLHRCQGVGVEVALKSLAIFFIGGAQSCAKLLRCQRVDGGGVPLDDYAFRTALPHLRCSDETKGAAMANYVGYSCAVAYGILIPGFLIYLIVKQSVTLALNQRFTSWAEAGEDKVTVHVGLLQAWGDHDKPDKESQTKSDYLLASAVAYAAVFFRGEVRMTWCQAYVTLEYVEGHGNVEDALEFEATSIFVWTTAAKKNKTAVALQRCQTITRMLSERQMLERESKADRIMAGATAIFFKYAACQDVWVEAALKGVAVALVATVDVNSVLLALFITVGMAILLGAQKPYRQRQVNDLQSGCFMCLSLAALGFYKNKLWLARGALALPFLGACVQMLRPDGLEELALRLHKQAIQAPWKDDSLELFVKTESFM